MSKALTSHGQLTPHGEAIARRACVLAAEGMLQKDIGDALRVSSGALSELKRNSPAFKAAFERAQLEGAQLAVDELRDILSLEPNPSRARIRMQALKLWLEKRFPDRYGQRQNVVVATVDIGSAMAEARTRAAKALGIQQVMTSQSTDSPSVDRLL